MFNLNEVAMSDTRLSSIESSGGICPSYFGDRRQHQVPSDWPSPVLRFMDPSGSNSANARPASTRPQPSARRPFRLTSPAKRRAQGDDGAMSPTAA